MEDFTSGGFSGGAEGQSPLEGGKRLRYRQSRRTAGGEAKAENRNHSLPRAKEHTLRSAATISPSPKLGSSSLSDASTCPKTN